MDPEETLRILAPKSRDNARTPYQWDGSRNAGFTKGTPWLRVNPCYPWINLEKDRKDPEGVFRGYQELIRIRKDHPVILDGEMDFYLEDDPRIIAYVRKNDEEALFILANLSGEEAELCLPGELTEKNWKLLFSGRPECSSGLKEKKRMAPWESEVYVLTD